ncbi:MAG: ribosome-associated protein [Saprospiraceae bacterium]
MNKPVLLKELTFKAIRSSGAGGQHVNKVSSQVVLSFDVSGSKGLVWREKSLLYKNIAARLTNEKILILSCDDVRSQLQNKNKVIERFFEIIKAGLHVPKRRIASKPSKNSIKRMKAKKGRRGDLKKLRQKPGLD